MTEPKDSDQRAPAPPPSPAQSPPHTPQPVDTSDESVAGEEDPGASIDQDVGAAAPARRPDEPKR